MIQLDSRAWTQLLTALTAMGLTITELDTSAGRVVVQVPPSR